MTVAAIKTSESVIRWHYLPWALLAIAVMVAATVADDLWFSARLDLPARREIMRRLTPQTLFLMPTVSIISGTSGWSLSVKLGYTGLEWPAYGWVAAALILVALMTIQGRGP
jgi:hypothetical protein